MTRAHEENSISLSNEKASNEKANHEEDQSKQVMEQKAREQMDQTTENTDGHDDRQTDKDQAKQSEHEAENSEHEPEDEEELDPYAQQKDESKAKINKTAKLVSKIEETVARHETKAECLKLGDETPSVFDQKLYQAAKTNRYDTGMSSEFLLKHLMQLDNCLSYGCGVIKVSRKALVCRIKEVMSRADSLSQQWLARVKLLEKLQAEVPACVCSSKTSNASDATNTGKPDEATKTDEGDKIEESSSERNADIHEDSDSDPEMDVEGCSDDEMDQEEDKSTTCNDDTTPTCSSESHPETKQAESVRLPLWQPRTQMYHDGSHVVVAAFVPGMELDQFNIMIDGTNLVVTGKKQPTMQDIISFQRGRAQNFGKLNLKIALPTNVVDTEGATAQYEDGILRVKFDKIQTQHYRQPMQRQAYGYPMHYRRPSHYRQPRTRNFFNSPMGFW